MRWIIFLCMLIPLTVVGQEQPKRYDHGPDSIRHDGVPRGQLTMHVWKTSKVFPSTARRYWVYVPQQYDAATPASLMVFQDGISSTKRRRNHRLFPTMRRWRAACGESVRNTQPYHR